MNARHLAGIGMTSMSMLALAAILGAPALLAQSGDQMNQEQPTPMGQSSSGAMGTATTNAQSSISVDDLDDRKVVNASGDEIGEIEEIARDNQDNSLNAVIEIEGFLGMGEKEVVVPLKDLQMRGDGKLLAPQSASTQEQLESMPEYDEKRYTELSDDDRIPGSAFAAFESDNTSGSRAQQDGGESGMR